ncbi:CAP domain-containing protein [Streptomyces sp. NPDC002446]
MPGQHRRHQCRTQCRTHHRRTRTRTRTRTRNRTKHRAIKAAIATVTGAVLGAAGLDAATATEAPLPGAASAASAAVSASASVPAPASADPTAYAHQVVRLVNEERAGHGCPPVRWNATLQRAAQRHSDDMAARRFFEHTNPDGVGPGERITAAGYEWSSYGENISVGRATPSEVMKAWMNSPGHRGNILQCDLADLGVGIHFGIGGPWWTQDFASPR